MTVLLAVVLTVVTLYAIAATFAVCVVWKASQGVVAGLRGLEAAWRSRPELPWPPEGARLVDGELVWAVIRKGATP